MTERKVINKLYGKLGLIDIPIIETDQERDVIWKALQLYEKHGKWVDVRQEGFTYNATCTACRVRNDIPHPLRAYYCPNCGAKMDKE